MKKLVFALLVTSVCLSACGRKEPTEQNTNDESHVITVEETQKEDTAYASDESVEQSEISDNPFNLPLGTNTGNGTMHISTSGGTSENGNIPKILVSSDSQLMQIVINASEFDRTHFSYVFIDGMLVNMNQYGDSQDTISIEGDNLKEGEHTVSVVQYEDDDSANAIITYKEAKYSIVVK